VNDDTASLSISDVSNPETNSGSTTFTFTISTTKNLGNPISFLATTRDGTAVSPIDYTPDSDNLIIPANSNFVTFGVTVNGDTTFEANEAFYVDLTNFSGAVLSEISLDKTMGTGNILNDDLLVLTGEVYEAMGKTAMFVGAPGLLANDVACCGTLTITKQPNFGVLLSVNQDGSFVYNATSTCAGIDKFTYQYTAVGQTKTAEATIVISACDPEKDPLQVFLYKKVDFVWTLPVGYANQQLKLRFTLIDPVKVFSKEYVIPVTAKTGYEVSISGMYVGLYTVDVYYNDGAVQSITPTPSEVYVNSKIDYYAAYKCCDYKTVVPSSA
jgi:hypothetical protein